MILYCYTIFAYVTGAGRSERWRWSKYGKHSSWSASADCHDDLRIVATGALCIFVPNATMEAAERQSYDFRECYWDPRARRYGSSVI
jgi:hypothetical protein